MENNEIRIRNILFEAWKIIKSLFSNNLLGLVLLFIVFIIPSILMVFSLLTNPIVYGLSILVFYIINLFIGIFLILVIGKKIKNNESPFVGNFNIIFKKFWDIITTSLIFLGALILKVLKWIIIPVVLWGLFFLLSDFFNFSLTSNFINVLNIIFPVGIVILMIIPLSQHAFGWIFAFFGVIFEDKKNIKALKYSWDLTYSYKKKIFWYYIGLILVLFVPVFLFSLIVLIVGSNIFFDMVYVIISFLMSLFSITFFTVLYFKFKESSGELKMMVNKWLIGVGIALIIIVPLAILASIVLSNLGQARSKAMEAIKQAELNEMMFREDSTSSFSESAD